jgi:hypothetical protein
VQRGEHERVVGARKVRQLAHHAVRLEAI